MASISAKFKLIDEMSAKLDKIAQSGRSALSQWEKAGAAIDAAFDGAATETAQTAQSINTSTDAVDKFGEATARAADKADEFTAAMDEMENATNAASTASDELASAGTETEEALNGVTESSERAGKKVKDYGEENEEAGRKSKKFGEETTEAIQSIEDLLITVGITKLLKGIGDAFVDCVGDAIEFESAITGVYKTVDGTPEQLAQISDEVKDLALNIPATTTEIAAVAEAAGQLGIATENVMAFSEVMINLGEATNLTSDEAASALAKFTNITGTSAEEYENLGSTIVALGNNFATTEADIVAMSTRMASAGTLAGMTESDILALAASLSSVGIEADAGGSSMSTLISKMQLAVETGNEQLEQFASVAGYSADEFTKKWGEDAAQALYAFIAGLQDTERNGMSATAVLDDMGITEIRLSNAIKALSNNSDSLGQALTFANGAWEENTALATEANTRYSTLESKLGMTKNAANNLSIAVGDVFTPTISMAASVGHSILTGLTDFVKAHPTVVKGVAAITIGVGAFTAAIVAYTVATKAAKVAQAALNAVQLANPYYLVGAAIAAVTVALVAFIASTAEAEDESKRLTAASKEQERQLQAMQAEYESVCDTYGETSYQAQELSWKIEEMTAQYEASKQTMEEYRNAFSSTMDSYYEMVKKHEEAEEKVTRESASIMSLCGRLETLTSQTEVTAAEQEEILAIIRKLNEEVPGLSLSYDKLTNSMSSSSEAIKALAEAEVASRKYDTYYEQLIEKMSKREELQEALTKATDNQSAAQSELNRLQESYDKWYEKHKYGLNSTKNASKMGQYMAKIADAQEDVNEFTDNVNEATKAIEDNEAEIERISTEMAKLSGTYEENAGALVTYEQAVEKSLSSVNAQITELCQKYDEAYEAARESIDGQIGLFDKIVVKAELSIADMQGAWESQILYLTSYTENLKKAMDFGLDRSLVEKLSDGSEESAAQLDTIISKVESLGGKTEAAKKFVDDFNTKFREVEKAKDDFAKQVADIETDFTGTMKTLEDQLDSTIDEMNMEADAAAAAKATMHGYISEIIAGGNSAVAAAADAAARVRAALQSGVATTASGGGWTSYADAAAAGYSNIRTASEFARGGADKNKYGSYQNYLDAMYKQYGGYAEGTDYADAGLKLVGEHGPELVEFAGGEKVYTADETEGILARSAAKEFYATPQGDIGKSETPKDSDGPKIIRLEINGAGAIEVDENVDEATVVAIMQQHLKPVLTSIVKQEIYEEGDLSYDY